MAMASRAPVYPYSTEFLTAHFMAHSDPQVMAVAERNGVLPMIFEHEAISCVFNDTLREGGLFSACVPLSSIFCGYFLLLLICL